MSRPPSKALLLVLALAAGPAFTQPVPAKPACPTASHGIMHFTDEWMREHHRKRASLPVHHASGLPSASTQVDLSSFANVAACGGYAGWNQGGCGNCWVFGSHMALSVEDGVASGTPQLFSTQWFDSDYYATDGQSTCNGGNDSMVGDWYNNHPKFIPWSNSGAGYADGNGPSTPVTPVSSISQTPSVGIGSISTSTIATSSVSQAQAIANIKSVLDTNTPVILMFFLPDAGWTDFDNSWSQSSENTPWAGVDSYSGQGQTGGHLVCIVGYDDSLGIWLVQNSWSTTNGRPHGRFALPQTMNYADSISSGWDQWEFDYFTTAGWSNAGTSAPTITTQPAGVKVALGATATFKVAATGAAPLAYQWYKDSTAISGASAASYTTPATTAADNGTTFYVTVTNAAGSVTSNTATLTVSSAPATPSITTQPASQTVLLGATATFKVAATGTAPLTYQWYKGSTAISGATAASYTTPATTAADNATTFHVKVSNAAGSATSSNATLTVSSSPAAPSITTQPTSQTVTLGAMATFKVVATGTAPLSYQWYKGTAAISGATAASYTTPATTAADNGTTFHVKVSNTSGSVTSGNATLTVGSTPVGSNLIVNGGFESGAKTWTAPSGVIGQFGTAAPAYAGTWDAWLSRTTMGRRRGNIQQTVTVPATITKATLAFHLHVNSGAGGTLAAQVRDTSGNILATLGTFNDSNAGTGYQVHTFDLSTYKGQTIQITFAATLARTRSGTGTSFVLDNVSLNVK